MKNGLMNSVRISVCAATLAAAGVSGVETPREWRVVPLERKTELALPLPPLAQVTSTDRSGRTWQQSGEMCGTVEGARGEFVHVLRANGWRVSKRITLGRARERSELLVLTAAKRRVLFMVWEKEIGKCGFAWGKEQ